MKKFLLFLVVALVLVGYVIPQFLLSSSYAMEREKTINASADEIHATVGDFTTWDDWTVWNAEKDPTIERTFEGTAGEVGHKMSWTADDLGDGTIEITEVNHTRIAYDMTFGDEEPAHCAFVLQSTSDDSTVVKWEMGGEIEGLPHNRYFGLMLDGMVGPDFETGLDNLATRMRAGATANADADTE